MDFEFLSVYKEKVLNLDGKTQNDLDESVEILQKWMKKVAHLPHHLSQEINYLENCLIKNKYSIEKVKTKIEYYCTGKTQYKYLIDAYIGKIEPLKENSFYHPVEELTENFERVWISRVEDETKYDFARDIAIGLMLREIVSRYDFNNGDIFILDFTNCTPHLATKIRLNLFADAAKMIFKGHSTRMKELHIVNKWASVIISMVKPFFPGKLKQRLFGHENLESVQELIPLKYFPEDYGGEQKSLKEIREDWDKLFKENQGKLEIILNTKSREEFRTQPINIGMQGTFKNLNVD